MKKLFVLDPVSLDGVLKGIKGRLDLKLLRTRAFRKGKALFSYQSAGKENRIWQKQQQ